MKNNLFLLALAALWLAGCKNDPPPPTTPETPAPLPTLDSVVEITTPDPYFLKKYQGKIDDKQAIEMVLVNWGDGFLSGRYWFVGKGKPIELSGELLDSLNKQFNIVEFKDGKEGAKFTGNLTNADSLTGTWTSADGKQTHPFYLLYAPPANDEANWTGNWHLNQVWDNGYITIGNVTKDSFDFALSVVRGSHVGTLEARASRQGSKAIFKQKTYENTPCELRFECFGDHILVEQPSDNLSCGFGARAYAAGRFEKKKFLHKTTLAVGTGNDDVFYAQATHDEFRRLVGDKQYELFAFNMEVKERSTNKQGQTVVTGAIPGLYTTNEAIIVFDDANKIWAATLEFKGGSDEPFVHVFTNDPTWKGKIHPDIESWRDGFRQYQVVF